MSRQERTRVPLFGMSEGQRETVLRLTINWLVMLADDLPAYGPGDIERVTGDLAALGRLSSWLGDEVVGVPDAQVKGLIERQVGETQHLDELKEELDELKEEYERDLHEHEAWVALLAHLPDAEAIADD